MTGYQSKRAAAQDKLAQPAQEPVAWSDEHLQFLNFLYGAGEFDGVWFDQKHPKENGEFWWRKHLRRLFDAPPQRPWVGLTKENMPDGENPMFDHEYFIAGMVFAAKILEEKNT